MGRQDFARKNDRGGTPARHQVVTRRRRAAPQGLVDATFPFAGTVSDESMLLAVLAACNSTDSTERILNRVLELITMALRGQIGELWIVAERTGIPELRASSSDHSHASDAFVAAAARLQAGEGLTLLRSVTRTGLRTLIEPGHSPEWSARATEAERAHIHCAYVFPVRIGGSIGGALAIFRDTAGSPSRNLFKAIELACYHLGLFLDRTSATHATREAALKFAALASTDSLTGLRNRREWDRILRTAPRQPFAMLALDVDALKQINDEHGHAAGDALLSSVGNTLGLLVRGWDVVARVGGDEFAALLPDVDATGAALVAERMRMAMHALTLVGSQARVSVGWSTAQGGADPVSVWHRADQHLVEAKRTGGDRVIGSEYGLGEMVLGAGIRYGEVGLRTVEDPSELATVFQPIVDLTSGTVLGYEALARPVGFADTDSVQAVFDAARSAGYIRDLDWICRRKAVEAARALPAGAVLFLNVSVAGLIDPMHPVDQLLLLLESARRPADTVVLEISEHGQPDDYEALFGVMPAYRAHGVRFALDDVGEGHSSLELVAASASEFLKLGSAVTKTLTDSSALAALEATTAFARATGTRVIAEGVENRFISEQLTRHGIRFGQGFALGRPVSIETLAQLPAADRPATLRARPVEPSAWQSDVRETRARA